MLYLGRVSLFCSERKRETEIEIGTITPRSLFIKAESVKLIPLVRV